MANKILSRPRATFHLLFSAAQHRCVTWKSIFTWILSRQLKTQALTQLYSLRMPARISETSPCWVCEEPEHPGPAVLLIAHPRSAQLQPAKGEGRHRIHRHRLAKVIILHYLLLAPGLSGTPLTVSCAQHTAPFTVWAGEGPGPWVCQIHSPGDSLCYGFGEKHTAVLLSVRVQKGAQRMDISHKTMHCGAGNEVRSVSSEITFSDQHKANGVSWANL